MQIFSILLFLFISLNNSVLFGSIDQASIDQSTLIRHSYLNTSASYGFKTDFKTRDSDHIDDALEIDLYGIKVEFVSSFDLAFNLLFPEIRLIACSQPRAPPIS
jgi:hypothetical protein